MQLVRPHERPQVHLLCRAGELLYLCLILFVFFQLFLKAALPLLDIKAVIPAVELRPAVGNVNTALHNAVEKPAVMAYYQHRAAKMQQILFQPLRCVQVKVVCRLVEQQYVRVLQNEPREVDARFLPTGERGERLRAHRRGNIQPVCHTAAVNVHIIPAKTAEVLAQAVVFRQKRAGGIVLHRARQLVNAAGDVVKPPVRVAQHVLHRPPVRVDGYLRDEPEAFARGYHHLTLVIVQLTREYAEKRRLAAAVVTENAHALPGVHRKAQSVQYILAYLEGFDQRADRNVYHVALLLLFEVIL